MTWKSGDGLRIAVIFVLIPLLALALIAPALGIPIAFAVIVAGSAFTVYHGYKTGIVFAGKKGLPSQPYSRKKSPAAYWIIMALWVAIILIVLFGIPFASNL